MTKQSLVYNMGKQNPRINHNKKLCVLKIRGIKSLLTEQNPRAYGIQGHFEQCLKQY